MTATLTTKQRLVFTCWSNDSQRIGEEGQCGVIYGRLFPTEELARRYYNSKIGNFTCMRGDRIVRLTVEDLGDA